MYGTMRRLATTCEGLTFCVYTNVLLPCELGCRFSKHAKLGYGNHCILFEASLGKIFMFSSYVYYSDCNL